MAGIAAWKARPVFITSTFQFMQDERDHLRRYVFLELEEKLKTLRHHLEWIDLRVGVKNASIASAEARKLEVFKEVCLHQSAKAGVRPARHWTGKPPPQTPAAGPSS